MPPRLWVLLCRWTPPYPGGDPRNVSRCSAGAQCLGPHLALCTASFGALKDKGANNFGFQEERRNCSQTTSPPVPFYLTVLPWPVYKGRGHRPLREVSGGVHL
eukprot:scaffold104058_cov18-Tisochrysis_lutea.AAC.3